MEAIVAIETISGAIGRADGSLILNNSEDKKFFKRTTQFKTNIVGRKTWDTLPVSVRERDVVIVSSTTVDKVRKMIENDKRGKILIGGAQTYKTFEDLVDVWYITWFVNSEVWGEDDLVCFYPDLTDFVLYREAKIDRRVTVCEYLRK